MKKLDKNGLMIAATCLLVLSAGILAGCLEESNGEKKLEWTDQTGSVLKLEEAPSRVVSLTPALTQIVVELDAGALLVGADSVSVGENSDLGLETVSTWEGLDSEKLVETDPDLVLMDKTLDITEASYQAIVDLSIPVYRAFPGDFDSVVELIGDIGEILDREDEAKEIGADMMDRKEAVVDSVSEIDESERPRVLYVTYYDGTGDPWAGTSSTFSGNLIELAGGRNTIDNSEGVVIQVSLETIIEEDPEVIITSQSSSWPTPSKDTILSDERWEDITAVKEGKVMDIEGNWIDRTGPDLIKGLEAINEALYPETG
jgi:iron complex transport system substrate-binding protein